MKDVDKVIAIFVELVVKTAMSAMLISIVFFTFKGACALAGILAA